jgi:hypothetical protein
MGDRDMNELGAMPPCGKSGEVTGMSFTGPERIIGTGDMWPLTWADDDNIYAAAGDNSGFLLRGLGVSPPSG